ncbi:MAG: RNA ligase family protein, partial [Limisphaerales bacterium]
ATKIFSKLVSEKKSKGYTEGESGTPYQHSEKQSAGVQCQLLNAIDEEEASRLVADDRWCMQEKLDGRRMLIQRKDAAIHGINRRGLLIGLPEPVFQIARVLQGNFILDGEAIGDVFHVFDLLEVNGFCIRKLPYRERWSQLLDLLDPIEQENLRIVPAACERGAKLELLRRLKQQNREGVVFKRLDAPYMSGRPNSGGTQLKHKFYATLSACVLKVNEQRSVEIGLLNNKARWQTAGNVTIPPNATVPRQGEIIEVRYLYAFKESGCLFQPTYLGPRTDLTLLACVAEQMKFKAGEDEEG